MVHGYTGDVVQQEGSAHAGGRRSQPEGRGLLLDADPQHSALGWANLDPRPDPNPAVQSADAGTLVRQARAAAGEYAWVVILPLL